MQNRPDASGVIGLAHSPTSGTVSASRSLLCNQVVWPRTSKSAKQADWLLPHGAELAIVGG
jgi:hypothetical protein